MLARQVWELESWLQVKNIKPRAILALEFQTMFPFSPVTWCGLGGGRLSLSGKQHGTSTAGPGRGTWTHLCPSCVPHGQRECTPLSE